MAVHLKPLPLPQCSQSAFNIMLWADGRACPVEEFLEALSHSQPVELTKVLALLRRTAESGLPVNTEKCRPVVGHPHLSELKSYQVRLYFMREGCVLILLEGCLKKKDKADPQALRRADGRMEAYWEVVGKDHNK